MRVKNEFILRQIAGESLLIPVGETAMSMKGLIALSESGCLLYERLRQECTRQDLVEALMEEYEVSAEVAGADVDAFLEQMRLLKMLEA